ncbi:MAG: hypothetical protein NDF54_09265, partial [archaeon GB-1867-035]|nr:hypothetical protein [Candidatus Culexmicrobium profundum]
SIIADLIFGLGFLSWIPMFFFRAAMGPGPHMAGAFPFLGGFFLGVLFLIGAILLLIAVYAYLLGAMRDLRDYDEVSFGTPHTLVKTGYVAGLNFNCSWSFNPSYSYWRYSNDCWIHIAVYR